MQACDLIITAPYFFYCSNQSSFHQDHGNKNFFSRLRSLVNKKIFWDEDLVLRKNYPSMVPAFDPRPGRVNVNQTQDFEVPSPFEGTSSNAQSTSKAPQDLLKSPIHSLHLTLKRAISTCNNNNSTEVVYLPLRFYC